MKLIHKAIKSPPLPSPKEASMITNVSQKTPLTISYINLDHITSPDPIDPQEDRKKSRITTKSAKNSGLKNGEKKQKEKFAKMMEFSLQANRQLTELDYRLSKLNRKKKTMEKLSAAAFVKKNVHF